MKLFNLPTSSAAVSVAFLLTVASAHPHERIRNGCLVQQSEIASQVLCGDAHTTKNCIRRTGSDKDSLKLCLVDAGCTEEEAETEAVWVAKLCQGGDDNSSQGAEETVEEVVIELRQIQEREDSTTTSTATSTSSTSTATSTDASSTSSTDSSSTAASTTASATSSTTASTSASATSSSSTASSTSSSTASTTSSSATSTSTSSSSSSGIPPVGYFVAALLGVYVAGCVGFICFKCCSERKQRKKARQAAEEKEALMNMRAK